MFNLWYYRMFTAEIWKSWSKQLVIFFSKKSNYCQCSLFSRVMFCELFVTEICTNVLAMLTWHFEKRKEKLKAIIWCDLFNARFTFNISRYFFFHYFFRFKCISSHWLLTIIVLPKISLWLFTTFTANWNDWANKI